MIDNKYKVSIIIPVYNTEKYVRESVLSICNQTLKEIEIICVNDGSTDSSPEILKELASADKRIVIINELNGGQSVARNTGIINSRGKYLYFLDSDDTLAKNALEQCYKHCEKGIFDFITFDSDIYNPDGFPAGNVLKYDRSQSLFENVTYQGIESFNLQLAKMDYTPSVPLLFINKQFLLNTKLCFFPGIIHEDQLFTAQLYLRATKMGYIQQKFYHRRMHQNSTMTNSFSWRNIQGYLTATDELIKIRSIFDQDACETIDILLSQMMDSIVRWEAYKLPREERISLAFICMKRYMKYIRKSSIFYLLLKPMMKKKKA